MKGIMEEKKKRWRPSLEAYRALEDEVSSLREQMMLLQTENNRLTVGLDEASDTVSMLVKDCDAWREKYQEMSRRYDGLKGRGLMARILNRGCDGQQ